MRAIIVAALQLIVLHRLDGGEVAINPAAVVSLHARAPSPREHHKLLPDAAHCAIRFSDGKFISVKETCAQIRQMLEGSP